MLLERKRDPGRSKNEMPTPPLSPLRKSSLSKSSKAPKDEDASSTSSSQRRPSRNFFSRSSKNRKQSSSSPIQSQIEREGSISTDGGGELMLSPTSSLMSSSGNGSSGDLHFDIEESIHGISERITPRSSSRAGTSISSGISDQIHNLSLDDRSNKPISVAQHQIHPEARRASLTRQYADWEINPTIQEDVLVEAVEKTKYGVGETVADHELNNDKGSLYLETNAIQQIDSSTDTISDTRSIETAPSSTTSDDARSFTNISSPSVSPKSKNKDRTRHSKVRGNVTDFKASLATGATGFTRALLRMEAAGVQAMFKKLTEQIEEWVDDEPVDVSFERRIWALVASQWLMFGKQLQSPSHDVMVEARIEDGRRILHLHGQLADGWVLAAKYPRTTVYSVTSKRVKAPSADKWPPPLNHHLLSTPSVRSPIPFPNHYFDCVVSRGLSSVCKADDLEHVLGEALRVLKPGGWLEVQTIDPTLTKAGDITRRWIESRVTIPMENSNFSTKPAEKILQSVTQHGLSEVRNARIALPVMATPAAKPSVEDGAQLGGVGDIEAQRMMAALGKHRYEENYREFLKAGHVGDGKPEWWWNSRAVQKECEREKDTCFALTLTFGRKL